RRGSVPRRFRLPADLRPSNCQTGVINAHPPPTPPGERSAAGFASASRSQSGGICYSRGCLRFHPLIALISVVLLGAGDAAAKTRHHRNPADDAALVKEAEALAAALSSIFDDVEAKIRPGASTQELDAVVRDGLARFGVDSLFVALGFPAALDASVND